MLVPLRPPFQGCPSHVWGHRVSPISDLCPTSSWSKEAATIKSVEFWNASRNQWCWQWCNGSQPVPSRYQGSSHVQISLGVCLIYSKPVVDPTSQKKTILVVPTRWPQAPTGQNCSCFRKCNALCSFNTYVSTCAFIHTLNLCSHVESLQKIVSTKKREHRGMLLSDA